jgi:hypothetical protein
MLKVSRLVRFEKKPSGKAPMLFSVKSKVVSRDRRPILDGSVSKLFSDRSMLVRSDRRPIVDGSASILFFDKSRLVSWERRPMLAGTVPENLLSVTTSDSNDV